MALMLMLMLIAAAAFVMAVVMVAVVMHMVVPILRVAMIGHRTIRMLHPAIRQMRMIVMVALDRERLGSGAAEQPHIFRALAHRLRRAPAADMAVQAYDGVGFGHHHMPVMRD